MSDLVPYQPQWVATLEPVAHLAAQIANTEFVPGSMRGNVAKVTACVLFGQELGLGPLQSLAKIDIIDGRPAPKAELARALVLAAGHEIVVSDLTATKCTVRGRRRGSDEWTSVTWTLDDAKRAGLDGKQNWRKWPRQMLAARATAELARLVFADCLGGVSLFAEELEDDTEPSATASSPQDAPGAPKRTRRLPVSPKPAPVDPGATESPIPPPYEPPLPGEDDIDAEVIESPPAVAEPHGASEKQTKLMFALLGEHGIKSKADRLAYCTLTIGREIESSNDLTAAEVSRIIDSLQAMSEPNEAPLPIDPEAPF